MQIRLGSSGYISFHNIRSGQLESNHLATRIFLIIIIFLPCILILITSFIFESSWREQERKKKMTQQQGKVLDGKGRKRHGMGEGPPACFTHWAWRGRGWKTTSTLLPHLIFSIMCKCVSRPCKRNNKNYKPYLNTSFKHGTKKKLQYMTYVKETIY